MGAERMARSGEWRIRHTETDNAPEGREVHWSSLQMWNLVGLGKLLAPTKWREDLSEIEWAALFIGPLSLVLGFGGILVIMWRRFGAAGFTAAALGLLASRPLLHFFRAGESDHHGWAALFAMYGVVLVIAGLQSSGKAARSWLAAGGVATAAGIWVSAATLLPILAATFAGAAITAFLDSRKSRADLDPQAWRVWSWAGAGAGIAFYALEYFPSHMGLRLEVNNPVYALAWLGGGELLACWVMFLQRGRIPVAGRRDGLVMGLCAVLVALPAVLLVFGGERVFVVSDRFLYSLHDFYINEFMSLFAVARGTGWTYAVFAHGLTLATLFAAGAALWIGKAGDRRVSLVVLALIPALVMAVLAIKQIRWGGTASALCIVAVAVCLWAMVPAWSRGRRWAVGLAWAALVAAALPHPVLVGLRAWEILSSEDSVDGNAVASAIMRDISHRLAARNPEKRAVVLGGPTASTEIAYYGGAKVIGTLYWENLEGLRKASEIYSTTNEEDALRRFSELGITHVVLFSWDSFGQRYVRLKRGLGREAEARDGFIPALLEGTRNQPTWLNPLYYPLPPEYKLGADAWVRIYEFAPGQTRARWFFQVGIYQLDAGKADLAERSFRESIRIDANDPAPRVPLIMLLAARGDAEGVKAEVAAFVKRHPGQAPDMLQSAINELRKAGRDAEADSIQEALVRNQELGV